LSKKPGVFIKTDLWDKFSVQRVVSLSTVPPQGLTHNREVWHENENALSYYEGKQQLVSRILSMIPEHHVYCEPFCGGTAIFFAKELLKIKIINDTNGKIINFYKVLGDDL
jgi:hypothetical protein